MRQSARTKVQEEPKAGRHPSVAKMRARIDALEVELAEARAQQIATAEVLSVINSPNDDLAPVFDTTGPRADGCRGLNDGDVLERDRVAVLLSAPSSLAGPPRVNRRLRGDPRACHHFFNRCYPGARALDAQPVRMLGQGGTDDVK